jgi:IS5 family transposase
MYCLQQWYNLADPAIEESIYDRISFQKFLDIDIVNDQIPDETTICRFRKLLNDHELQKKIFELINKKLEEKGLICKQGSIVDATIINAPSSTKNKEKQRDPEMHSTGKGGQYYFGMKAHI